MVEEMFGFALIGFGVWIFIGLVTIAILWFTSPIWVPAIRFMLGVAIDLIMIPIKLLTLGKNNTKKLQRNSKKKVFK